MLVLSRKPGQELVIGDDIRITVLDVRGDKVRLGINAPREIPVHRREVRDRRQRSSLPRPDGSYRPVENHAS